MADDSEEVPADEKDAADAAWKKAQAEKARRQRETWFERRANFNALFAEQLSGDNLKKFQALTADADEKFTWQIVLAAYVRALDQNAFVRLSDKGMIGDKAFNEMFDPLVQSLKLKGKEAKWTPTKYATADYRLKKASAAVFEPGKPDWIGTQFNIYSPNDITPLPCETDEIGDPCNVILDHINYLIPNKRERRLLCDFLKWMIQHPDHKMKFCLVIVGDRGTGKSWFSKLLTALMGEGNVLVIEKSDTMTATFNYEQKNRQAIFVDEILPGGKKDLVAAMEPLITGNKIRIEPKGVNAFYIANRTNFMGVTNYQNALKLDRRARKWAIVQSTQDEYGADENGGAETEAHKLYYNRLHGTTPDDGLGPVTDDVRRFLGWLQTDPISADFDPDHAPQTEAKTEVAEATETTIESDVQSMVTDKRAPFCYELLTVGEVFEELSGTDATRSRKAIEAEIAAAMNSAGCRRLDVGQVWRPGHKTPLRLWVPAKRLLAKFEHMDKKQLAEFYAAERVEKPAEPDNPADFEPGGVKPRASYARH